ncbi:hypothetical protein KJ866_02775 [Patescibacteria group bacterium]|nr:hypothetical protein [Patescibacteria group bacterium]MBU2219822.1 hypothetical protein [Patescibacteria group bacterium]MBU2264680.1 hypothetical protein [Patescibacteria group bacterium]
MPNQLDFSMPGPQFNGPAPDNWFRQNWRKLAAVLILALLATGTVYFYRNYQKRIATLKPALEKIITSASPIVNAPVTAANDNQIKETSTPKATIDESGVTVFAAKGNGQTHLARQALKEYLKDKPELSQKIGAEQRIYIEDYLRKHLADQSIVLHVGDQLTFSNNNIENAINAALALNDSQIKNLSQYVPLVPSLMTP